MRPLVIACALCSIAASETPGKYWFNAMERTPGFEIVASEALFKTAQWNGDELAWVCTYTYQFPANPLAPLNGAWRFGAAAGTMSGTCPKTVLYVVSLDPAATSPDIRPGTLVSSIHPPAETGWNSRKFVCVWRVDEIGLDFQSAELFDRCPDVMDIWILPVPKGPAQKAQTTRL